MSYRTHLTVDSALRSILKRTGHIGLGLGAFAPVLALANPTGGQVVAGGATIKNPNANTTVVKQSSSSAIIDWQQFNIGKGQYVQFLQPSSSSVILNRVIGGGGTSIFGSLTGNGQVFLVNTNGVFFGKGASIDAQGFLASTLDISDSNFLSGHYLFDKGSNADAQVINQGNITAHKGGYVVLAGDYAENDGLISAQSGHIVLASGSKSTLTLNGNSLVSYAVNQATLSQLAGANNAGKLSADGGTVLMTADVANLLKATVVNNTGLIEAHAISKDGGTIQLLATGGNIQNAGTLDASATHAGQQGGTITLKGDGKTTLTDASKIFATGDGANGGNVEVSGDTLNMRGSLKLGKGGKLLLDPESIQITSGSTNSPGAASNNTSHGKIGIKFIEGQLASQASVTISAHSFMNASVNAKTLTTTATGNLKLKAGHGIEMGGLDIAIGGKLTVDMGYGSFGHLQAASIDLEASHSFLHLAPAVVNSKGVVTTYSLKATTGDITINGGAILSSHNASSHDTVALSAKDKITVNDNVSLITKLVAKASSGYASFNGSITANQGVSIQGQGVFVDGFIFAYGGAAVDLEGNTFVTVLEDLQGGDITLKAAHGNVNVGSISANGVLKISASAGANVSFGHNGSSALISGHKGVQISGKQVLHTGGLLIKADSGSITVGASLGKDTAALHGDLTLQAQKGIKLDSGVFVTGHLEVEGSALAYTGKAATFTLSGDSGLKLDAAIGTAKAPVKYAVNLDAGAGQLQVHRSIYSAKSIGIAQAGSGTSAGIGVYVGAADGTAVTLSAKGPISITGDLVGIGFAGASSGSAIPGDAAVVISADDGNAKTVTDTLTLHANGGNLLVHGGSGSDLNDGSANLSRDRSVTLHAGGDVVLSGNEVHLTVGREQASVSSAGGALSVKNSISVTAGRDILINAAADARLGGGSELGHALGGSKTESLALTGGVSLVAGRDINFQTKSVHLDAGTASAGAHGAATVAATADVSLTAGRDVILQASASSFAVASAGYAEVSAITTAAKQKTSATASAGINIKAGQDLSLSGLDVNMRAGVDAASGAQVSAGQSGAKATAVAHADVTFSAGDAITVTAHSVDVQGGSGAAIAHSSFVGSPANNSVSWDPTRVSATGQKAGASLTATADVSLKAGAGGIALTAISNLTLSAGQQAALAIQVDGGKLGGKASVDAEAKVSLAATGDVSLKAGANLHVRGGANAAGIAQSFSATFHGISTFSQVVTGSQAAHLHAGAGGAANLKTDASVSITAGGALSLADTNLAGGERISISAGIRPAGSIGITATGAKTVANAVIDTGVSLTAGAGGLNIETHSNSGGLLQILAGSAGSRAQIASRADVSANFGAKAGLAVDSGIVLSTKGDLTLAARAGVLVDGGLNGFRSAEVHASSGAATASLQDGVSITAGANFDATAADIHIQTASQQARSASVSAIGIGAKAGLNADGRVSISTGGELQVGTAVFHILGGLNDASGAALTGSIGGSAALTTQAGVSLAAGGSLVANITGSGGNASFVGGNGGQDDLTARHGKATLTVDGSLSLSAKKNIFLGAPQINVQTGILIGKSDDIQATAGTATVTALDGIGFKAGTDFSVSAAASDLTIQGGGSAGAHATLDVTANLSIAAGSDVNLKGHGIDLEAGNFAARFLGATASSGGAITTDVSTGINVTAGKSFLANAQSNSLILFTGQFAAERDTLEAAHGSVTLEADAGLHVTAQTTLTLEGNGAGLLRPQAGAGSHNILGATGGTINVTALSDLSLTAAGALAVDFADLKIGGTTGQGPAANNRIDTVGAGAKTTLLANGSVTLSGGTIALDAGGSLHINGGEDALRRGSIHADSGAVVSETALGGIAIKATGAFTASAGTALAIKGGLQVAQSFSIEAIGPGAKATAAVDSSVSISAKGAVTLKGQSVTASGGQRLGQSDSMNAASGGAAALSAKSGIAITTAGAFKDVATANLVLRGGSAEAERTSIEAVAGKGAISMDTGITVAALSVALSAGGRIDVGGGARAGITGNVKAEAKGTATDTLTAGVNLTASKSILATLTGSGSNNHLFLFGGTAAGSGLGVTGDAGGIANANVSAGVNLKVTAKGGSVTLETGTQVNSFLAVIGGASVARGAHADASSGGAATLSLGNGISISAPGAVTLAASHGVMSIGETIVAPSIAAGTNGKPSKASLSVTTGISVKAGTDLTLTADSAMRLFTAPSAGVNMNALAVAIGNTTVSVDDHLSFTAGGKLSLVLNNGNLNISAGKNTGLGGAVHAIGAASKAGVTINSSVSLTAGGALTDSGVNTLSVQAGRFPTSSGTLAVGSSGGGKATALLDASVTLKGKTLSLAHSGGLVTASTANVVDGGLTEKGTIITSGGTISSFAPQDLGTLQQGALLMSVETVLGAPAGEAVTAYSPQAATAIGGAGGCSLLRDDGSRCRLVY